MSDAPQDKDQEQEQTWVPVARMRYMSARKEYLVFREWIEMGATALQADLSARAKEGWGITSVTHYGSHNSGVLVVMEREVEA